MYEEKGLEIPTEQSTHVFFLQKSEITRCQHSDMRREKNAQLKTKNF